MVNLFEHSTCSFIATTVPEGNMAVPRADASKDDRALYLQKLRFLLRQDRIIATRFAVAVPVHGDAIYHVEEHSPLQEINSSFRPDIDGLATAIPQAALVVTGGDCPPVMVFDPVQKAVALVHSGRKGTALRIAAKAVERLHDEYGSEQRNLRAVIGPGICPSHYEVDAASAEPFFPFGERLVKPLGGKFLLDLPGLIAVQLNRSGIPTDNIRSYANCTFDDPRFFSYRADRASRVLGPTDRARVQAFIACIH